MATPKPPAEPPKARPAPRRQGKLTPTLRDELCALLRRGHYIHSACAYVGIHRDTYRAWRAKGDDARALRSEGRKVPAALKPYLEFLDETDTAREYGEAWLVERTLDAAENPREHGRWQAYMTVLERSRPDRWARKRREEKPLGEDKPKLPPLIDPAKLSDDELDVLEGLLAKAQPEAT